MKPVAVYVHCPFCPSKCGYCDFNSYAMSGEVIGRTARAIRAEVLASPWRGQPAKTIFFGGGTPTFFSEDELLPILDAVFEVHPPIPGCEVTSEANPGTVDRPKFAAMRRAGFNRISLGAQSFGREDLVRLGRVHQAGEVGLAVAAAREACFENVNVDLMFALPGQSLAAWERNLDLALALAPEHLSLYGLTIEPNTRYYKLHRRGMLDLPTEETQLAMYDRACDRMEAAGLRRYEISNFALPGRECRHNLEYWRGADYLGYGPGAVGRVGRRRATNIKHPERYAQAVEGGEPLACEEETLDDEACNLERIMLGIRLAEGLPLDAATTSDKGLRRCVDRGWLRIDAGRALLTPAGLHLASEAAAELAP